MTPIEEAVNAAVDARLKALKVGPDTNKELTIKQFTDRMVDMIHKIWRQNGWTDLKDRARCNTREEREEGRIKFGQLCDLIDKTAKDSKITDAIETAAAPMLLPQVVTRIVQEAAEPILIGTSLLKRINFSAADQIRFPAVGGGMWAEDIPEGGEYPEQVLDFAGYVLANIGKSGLAVRITDEMRRYAMFDVMTMHMQAGGRALARHKENKIFQMLWGSGATIFDNSGGASSDGFTGGRAINALYNKTLSLDDLHVMLARILDRGFQPSMILMNPMGWIIFARDGIMRAFGFANGGPMWQAAQGKPGQGPSTGGLNLGPSVGQDPDEMNPQSTLNTPVPSIFPTPLTVMVSPFVPFNEASKTIDFAIADSNELGAIVVDEDPVTETWDDPRRDIQSLKIRERYGLCVFNQGEAIGWAKGIRLARNYDWEDNLSVMWQLGSGQLPSGFVPGI